MNVHFQHLQAFGWNKFFETHFKPYAESGYSAGRVVQEDKHLYRVQTEDGELLAEITGKMRHEAVSREDLPAVGDWVVIQPRLEESKATIHAILPRKSKFTRKMAGKPTEAQIVGANIDTVFLMTSLNQDFNPRRIERYLVVAWDSGANPVIVLNKADLCDDVGAKVEQIQEEALGVPVHALSAIKNEGLDALAPYLGAGQTVALLGSSGVGKSTLINHLVGQELLKVQEVRTQDGRGRHTTSHRELVLLPQGGLVLDTPGMRELQLWDGAEGLQVAFDEIEALARSCHFRNCKHREEPRCAVREGLEAGTLDLARYHNYEKLQRELHYLAVRQDNRALSTQKKKWKKLCQMAKRRSQMKRMGD